DRAMGLFINTLPVRIRVGGELAEETVRKTHGMLAELMRHEHASLALAQRCSGVAAPMPLFSSLFNYRHSPRDVQPSEEAERAWAGVDVIGGQERSNYPLVLSIDDRGDQFALTAQVATPNSAARICEYMNQSLAGLVEALENLSETAMRTIDALPEAE